MPPAPPPGFLDVPFLLEASHPRQSTGWFWYALGGFLLVVFASTYAGMQSPEASTAVNALSWIAMLGIMAAMSGVSWTAISRARREQAQMETIEELVQLRRWTQAAAAINAMLSLPTRTNYARARALVFLTLVLGRYGRYTDAMTVQEHLLNELDLDANTAYGLRLSHAMALLQDDRLFDADRAISELRRSGNDANAAGLALLEIYRDVKTGHPMEAIEIFDARLPVMRKQLGHRVADAWALIAKAYDLLEREPEARTAYENATLLAPVAELHRRYAEAASLGAKYAPSEAPVEIR